MARRVFLSAIEYDKHVNSRDFNQIMQTSIQRLLCTQGGGANHVRDYSQSEQACWMVTCLRYVTRVVTVFTVGFYVGGVTYCVLTGQCHGELCRFTPATQFRLNDVSRIGAETWEQGEQVLPTGSVEHGA